MPKPANAPTRALPNQHASLVIPTHDLLASAPTHEEREHRAAVLAQIEAKLQAEGPHQARPDATRGRQFKPFAALKGFEEETAAQETVDRTGLSFDAAPEING